MCNRLVANGTALEGTVRHFCAWNRKVMKPSGNQFKELSMTEKDIRSKFRRLNYLSLRLGREMLVQQIQRN
jgi:hypothetical protein